MALRRCDGSASDRAQAAASHFPIIVLIDVIVPGADGASEDEAAQEENTVRFEDVMRRGQRICYTCSVTCPDHVREIECVEARRSLDAH